MVLRDDAMLAPCDSRLWAMWAMQPLWSTATIEFRPQYTVQKHDGCFYQPGLPHLQSR